MKVYDGFIFFNELDLLEIRLNILNNFVDRFVLVEATKTFTNKPKPLHFNENKERFSKFLHKIDHIIIDDYPEFESPWTYEYHQRNSIAQGFKNCEPDDIIMISDIDEIPNPAAINVNKIKGFTALEQLVFYFYVNFIPVASPLWHGTLISPYSVYQAFPHSTCSLRRLTNKKIIHKIKIIKNGGWHFTFLGGVEAVKRKIEAYSHQEFNKPEFIDNELLEKNIKTGKFHLFKTDNKEMLLKAVHLDDKFPKYLTDNKEKYSHLIVDAPNNQYADIQKIVRHYEFKRLILKLPERIKLMIKYSNKSAMDILTQK